MQAYDIDLFDVDAGVITDLQARGRIVICYFSAGTLIKGWDLDPWMLACE